jgi:hypothetical protein
VYKIRLLQTKMLDGEFALPRIQTVNFVDRSFLRPQSSPMGFVDKRGRHCPQGSFRAAPGVRFGAGFSGRLTAPPPYLAS